MACNVVYALIAPAVLRHRWNIRIALIGLYLLLLEIHQQEEAEAMERLMNWPTTDRQPAPSTSREPAPPKAVAGLALGFLRKQGDHRDAYGGLVQSGPANLCGP